MKSTTTTKSTTAFRLCVLALAICSAGLASEKIVTAMGNDMSPVQKMLDDGWTVKTSHAVALSTNLNGGYLRQDVMHVFVVAPPADLAEREAKRQAEAKAAFDKRRAEWPAKQPQPKKP